LPDGHQRAELIERKGGGKTNPNGLRRFSSTGYKKSVQNKPIEVMRLLINDLRESWASFSNRMFGCSKAFDQEIQKRLSRGAPATGVGRIEQGYDSQKSRIEKNILAASHRRGERAPRCSPRNTERWETGQNGPDEPGIPDPESRTTLVGSMPEIACGISILMAGTPGLGDYAPARVG
jgi:hypothetical protein